MIEIIEKPTKPLDDECCGNSCDPCVWDIFYEELSSYRQQQRSLRKQEDKPITN